MHTQTVNDRAQTPVLGWKIKKTTNAGKTCYKIEAVSGGMSVKFLNLVYHNQVMEHFNSERPVRFNIDNGPITISSIFDAGIESGTLTKLKITLFDR